MHTMRSNRSFPCLYAVMTHKTLESYEALFTFMTAKAATLFPGDPHPIKWENTLTDFESGLLPAIQGHDFRTAAPVIPRGCHFHYTQCIWRQVQREGLAHAYRVQPLVKRFIRGLFAVPYLPAKEVQAGYNDFIGTQASQDAEAQFPKLVNYFNNNWLHGIYPIQMWNVYDACEIRTNNNIEGWHRDCRVCFGKHRILRIFLAKLHSLHTS